MNTIEEVLAFNKTFVEEKRYEQFETDKYPEKKLAVLSCMDTRLTELLPAALGLKNGDECGRRDRAPLRQCDPFPARRDLRAGRGEHHGGWP